MNYIPYSDNELISTDFFDVLGGTKAPVYSTPVTPKENYLLSMKGEKPLWIPMFSDCRKFQPSCIPDNPPRGIVLGDETLDRTGFTGGKDMFGIDWVFVPEVGGSTVRPGNPFITDAEELCSKPVWPDPDKWDWEGAVCKNRNYLDTSFVLNSTIFCGFFERLISFMDFDNAAVALIDEDSKPYVHIFFDRLCQLYEKIIFNMHKYFHLDSIEFHDDWGSQRAPLFSISTIREMIVPYMKRIADFTHSLGMIFELHCCGCNALLTPAMIDAGVDMWSPQFNANDTTQIFEDYGDRITIGISCQLPLGSPDNEYIKWAEMFVEKYVGRTDKRTPFLHDMRTPLCFRETVYKLSRIKLCGKE